MQEEFYQMNRNNNKKTYKHFITIYLLLKLPIMTQLLSFICIAYFAYSTLYISNCTGYLNKIQLKYAKYIMGSPTTPQDIKQATRELLVESYSPWLHKQYNSFIRKNAKTMNRIYVRELYQYAIYGLLESLQNYNGSYGLHTYADRFVQGQMYKGMNELSILQPIKFSQMRKGERSLKPVLVSYDDYWTFDKLPKKTDTILHELQTIKHINEILEEAPGEYKRLFYLRYDYMTLQKKHSISDICQLEAFSEETYRQKMNEIICFIEERV